jgi:hypothetical protein
MPRHRSTPGLTAKRWTWNRPCGSLSGRRRCGSGSPRATRAPRPQRVSTSRATHPPRPRCSAATAVARCLPLMRLRRKRDRHQHRPRHRRRRDSVPGQVRRARQQPCGERIPDPDSPALAPGAAAQEPEPCTRSRRSASPPDNPRPEPSAVVPHTGICAGAAREGGPYRDSVQMSLANRDANRFAGCQRKPRATAMTWPPTSG